jgi:hypothetical protein
MNVEIGTETPIFLFWEYLFRNLGILSLQFSADTPLGFLLSRRIIVIVMSKLCHAKLDPIGPEHITPCKGINRYFLRI